MCGRTQSETIITVKVCKISERQRALAKTAETSSMMQTSLKLSVMAAAMLGVIVVVNMLQAPVPKAPPPMPFTPPPTQAPSTTTTTTSSTGNTAAPSVASEPAEEPKMQPDVQQPPVSAPAQGPYTYQQPAPNVYSLPTRAESIRVLRQHNMDRSSALHSEDARVVDVTIVSTDQREMLVNVTVQALTTVHSLDLVITPMVLGAASLAGNASAELFGVLADADAGDAVVVQVRIPRQTFEYRLPMPATAKERESQLAKFYYDPERYPYKWAGDGGSSNPNDRNACMDFFGRAALSLPQPLTFAELGSGTGGMLVYIAAMLQELSPESYILSVEFEKYRHDGIREALSDLKLNDHVLYFTGDVTKLNWNYGPIGAIFADLNSWPPTADALIDLSQYLVVGGYIGFHDTYYPEPSYNNYRNGIKRLLDSGQFQLVNSGYLYVLQKVGRRSSSAVQSLRIVSRTNGHRYADQVFAPWAIPSARPTDMLYSSADCVEMDITN